MTGPQHDDEFEAYLKRRLPIDQRLSRLERPEPPEELDRLIIAKARQAIQSSSPVRVFRAPKWAVPVGLAATIVISFTVLLNLGAPAVKRQEAPVLMTDLKAERPLADAAPLAAAPEIAMDPVKSSLPKRESGSRSPGASEKAKNGAARREPAAAPWKIPVETQSTAITDTTSQPLQAPSADSAVRADIPPPAAESPPSKIAIETPSFPLAPDLRSETQSTAIVDTTNQHVPAPPPRPLRDAASWLKRIEKLRVEGKTAEAEQELKRFRDAYPDYKPRGSASD